MIIFELILVHYMENNLHINLTLGPTFSYAFLFLFANMSMRPGHPFRLKRFHRRLIISHKLTSFDHFLACSFLSDAGSCNLVVLAYKDLQIFSLMISFSNLVV